MRWRLLIFVCFWHTIVGAVPEPVCSKWLKASHIDAKAKDCFQRCFTALVGPAEWECSNQCKDLCQPDVKIWLYFGNGMLNTKQDARQSLDLFKKKLYPFLKSKYPSTMRFLIHPDMAAVAYNTNMLAPIQLLEAIEQKGAAKYTDFFYWLSGLKAAPDWFRKKMIEIGTDARFARMLDTDLKKQVDNYLMHLKEGDAVIVVAHSQGNLYRDEAFHLIEELSGDPTIPSFGSVSVATPSENASSGAIPGGSKWYTTLFSDPVITKIPLVLRANIKNDRSGPFDHFFVNYIDGNNSGPKILEDAACVLSQLNGALINLPTGMHEDGCHPDEE